jgi:Glycosyl hydrolase family 81 C-terminal domain
MNTRLASLALIFFSFAKIGMRFQASLWVAMLLLVPAAPIARGADVISNGPVSFLKGDDAINPRPGRQGGGGQFNSLFYVVPGEGESPEAGHPDRHQLPNEKFFIAYEATAGPVQSNDWWTGVGLQWYVDQTNSGWAFSWNDGVIRSSGFISEPFYYQFVDFTGASGSQQPPLPPPHGLRLWNQNAIAVKTDGKIKPDDPFNPANNIVDRAFLAPEVQAVVTVGLDGVHPIGTTKPTSAPWTNVRVRKHSDWGAVLTYKDGPNEMEITTANGSPFTWLERKQGQANFLVWAGGPTDQGGAPTVWQNENGVLGLTIDSSFNPDNAIPQTVSKAAYVVIADQGTWVRTDATSGNQSLFRNSSATKVVVLAMPHNIRFDTISLQRAATNLKPFACRKVVSTQIDYPPIPGSQTSVNINGETVTLGYSLTDHRVALQLRLETQPFLPNCTAPDPVQLLFPHHSKSLHPGQRPNVDGRYTWNSIMGPLRLYKGGSFVQLIDTNGFLPFFSDQVVESNLQNPLQARQLAVDDVYETMRNWFYQEEFQTGGNHIDSFLRNIGTYDNQQFNTYEQGLSTLIESMTIADQLAHSSKLTGNDTSTNSLHACLCKPKTQVAAEMRDYILQALKELVGQWADVYTAQFIQYNPTFKTTYGFPAGFGSVQNLNDHHFHFGYFLRAAAAIGRYDRAWLDGYLPFFDELRKDVANYDRSNTNYPFLRNFSPFYGHNWADGTSQNGANQESTSEAINFSTGLMELGLLLGNNEWRDMGMYMYEQEILAAEQYWFNQDATLPNVVPRPPVNPNDIRYNGNWPEQFVTFKGPDNGVWHTTLAGILGQRFVKRETFFGGIDATYFIHLIPMSANTLYVGRNQAWLQATWKQYLLDTGAQGNPNFQSGNEVFVAAWQARMPDSGQGINGTGLTPALTRIARPHAFQFYGTNTMAKYWAYTNSLFGQVDASIVADTPAYGAFKEAGGSSSFVAYNPTEQAITVNFKNRVTNTVVATLAVPGQSIASKSGGRTSTFKPSHITTPGGRLYLGPTTGPTPLPMTGQLTSAPGTWLPPNGTFPFPRLSTDISRIMPSLSIVPVATGNCSDIDLPGGEHCPNSNKAYAEWTGTFKGTLVGSKPFTQMVVYTDPALHVGWQQDPGIRANTHVRVEYFFDSNNTDPDRIEVYTLPSVNGNTFVMLQNKMTPYYFGCYSDQSNFGACNNMDSGLYGPDNPALSPGKIALDDRFGPATPFPASVTCGKIKVQVYGQAGPDNPIKVPVPVSVGTSPLLNRASWVHPPYDGGECPP